MEKYKAQDLLQPGQSLRYDSGQAPIQSGQAVLIIIVGMMIALTIGLSIATQSIINLKTSTDEEQSQRAFSAAEAGIEQALKNNEGASNISLNNNATIKEVTVNNIDQDDIILNDGVPVLRDDPVDVWLSQYPDYTFPQSGTLTIYWGSSTDCNEAALEVVKITGANPNASSVEKFAFDPCGARGNGFTNPGGANYTTGSFIVGGAGGPTLRNQATLPVTSGLLVRIIPLYHDTTIGVIASGGLNLPSQGSRIESVGESGEAQRKITVYRGYPKIPYEFFPNAIFSP